MRRAVYSGNSGRRVRKTQRSELEEGLAMQLRSLRLPEPVREHRFCAHLVGMGPGVKSRLLEAGLKDWRFDFAWPGVKLAVEVEGGGWVQGRHNTGAGSAGDMVKYHHAALQGWYLYRCDGALIKSGQAVQFIEQYLAGAAAGESNNQ